MVCIDERTPVANGKKLVIVESPTKMKSIQGYLGDGYEVLSSVGHIRDLASKKEIPADNGGVRQVLHRRRERLRPLLRRERPQDQERSPSSSAPCAVPTKSCSPLMATARRGPSRGTCARFSSPRSPCAAWCSTRSPRTPFQDAVNHTLDLDESHVDSAGDAPRARSPVAVGTSLRSWRKVGSGREGTALSAVAVQSAATRMVVER